MKLSRKLKHIIVPMVLLPFVFILLSVVVAGYKYMGSIYGEGVELEDYNDLANPVQVITMLTSEIYGQLTMVATDEPEKLEDKTYLEEMNNKLTQCNASLIVKVGDSIIYNGNHLDDAFMNKLPAYNEYFNNDNTGVYISGNNPSFVRQISYLNTNGEETDLYIVSSLSQTAPQFKRIVINLLLSIVTVLIMVSMFISWFVYWEFIRPINALKIGTNYIKAGNLDRDVEVINDDEIGELCESFNEMRAKLKESIDLRLRYEEENRELVSNISHDLKTPITAIKGYVEGIMDGVADTPEKMDRYIKTIYKKANEMDALINELSVYSKIDSSTIPYNFREISVAGYFGDCVEELGIDLESKNMKLNYINLCKKDTKVILDPEQIKRVVNNIITNAVKYNDKEQGIINIRIRDVKDGIEVEIEDNGKGIKEGELPYVFDRMYRADSSRNSSTVGSGLGLSIAKKIIEEHGGDIVAQSKEGMDTTIRFTLKSSKENVDGQDTNY